MHDEMLLALMTESSSLFSPSSSLFSPSSSLFFSLLLSSHPLLLTLFFSLLTLFFSLLTLLQVLNCLEALAVRGGALTTCSASAAFGMCRAPCTPAVSVEVAGEGGAVGARARSLEHSRVRCTHKGQGRTRGRGTRVYRITVGLEEGVCGGGKR